MIIPELYDYITSLGGADYKGLVISFFTLTALLSRPFSGKLADTVGRIPVMVFGAGVCFVCGFLYPLTTTVWAFLGLRLLHGFSTGFKPTGTTAYLADVVPKARRGEALGILGVAGSSGMAIGPAVGSFIATEISLDMMFYCSSLCGILSVLILVGMKESLQDKQSFHPKLLRVKWKDVYEPRVLPPAFVMLLTIYSFGMILTIIPDLSVHVGLVNKGWFFTCFVITSIGVRVFAGKASDKYGRRATMKVGLVLLAASMITTGLSTTPLTLLLSAGLFGIAAGVNSPTLFAWTIDRSLEAHIGRGMGTLFIFLEFGIMVGAFCSAEIYGNDPDRFKYAFFTAATLAMVAFGYLFIPSKK